MSVLLLVSAIITLVLILLFVGGRVLPDRYECAASAVVSAPLDAVWRRVNDPIANPIAGKMARSVAIRDGGWTEDLGASTLEVRVSLDEANGRVTRQVKDSVVPMTACNVVTLTSVDAGTRVDVDHEVVIQLGTWHSPIFRWAMLLTGGGRQSVRTWIAELEGSP